MIGLSFVPTPPTGHHALADSQKKQTLTTKTTNVEAVEAPPTPEAVQSTVPVPEPVVDTPTYPTEAVAIMSAASIMPEDYDYVRYIVEREGGWCATRWQGQTNCTGVYDPNFGSMTDPWKGYGLCQSTPGIKMAITGEDYITNPVTQMKWCNSYAMSRYGSWAAAYTHWINHHNW